MFFGLVDEVFDVLDVNLVSIDNCLIDIMFIMLSKFICVDVGSIVDIVFMVRDGVGLEFICVMIFGLIFECLELLVILNFCGGDILFLFVNLLLLGSEGFFYEWYLNDIFFFVDENFVIFNVDGSLFGVYKVVVEGIMGCCLEGMVLVNVEEIMYWLEIVINIFICSMDDIVLGVMDLFLDNDVIYYWY